MNNIWKFSLVLAFSIMGDQLIKGTIQSFIQNNSDHYIIFDQIFYLVRERNYKQILGLSFFDKVLLDNYLAVVIDSILILGSLYMIIINRNKNLFLGWSYTLILSGLLTSWIDRITQGFTLNYFLFKAFDTKVTTAFGDIFFMLGILLVIFEKIRRKKNSTHPF